jgi:hypothetical protein
MRREKEDEIAHCLLELIDYLGRLKRMDLLFEYHSDLFKMNEDLMNYEEAGETLI